jgi:hypothetical protein
MSIIPFLFFFFSSLLFPFPFYFSFLLPIELLPLSTHFFIRILSPVFTTVSSTELYPCRSFRPRRPAAPLAGVLPRAGRLPACGRLPAHCRLPALPPTSPSASRLPHDGLQLCLPPASSTPAGERCDRPRMCPPPASTSPAPAPLASIAVAVELRVVPEGKSGASWRAPPKCTAVHGREEPQAKRTKLLFFSCVRAFLL